MKKNFIIIIGMILTFSTIYSVDAASGYAFSVGTNYGSNNINTSVDANYVNDVLGNMGYTTYKTIIPTFSVMTGQFSSGRSRLESDILFFAGHANSTTMYWNYLSKGGDYAQAIKNVDNGYCDVNWTYTGLGMYDMSKVDFAFFAGCETAKGSNNITQYTYNQGAKTTLGWTVSVNDADAYAWEQKFFTKLKSGATISAAVNYANSFTYTTTTVKNTKLYGTTSATINSSSLETINTDLNINLLKSHSIGTRLDNQSLHVEQINKLINKEFNEEYTTKDFIIETATTDDGIIYDYYLAINGIKTNVGYTVFVSNNRVVSIIDNMKENTMESLRYQLNSKLMSKKNSFDKEEIKKDALSRIDINYSSNILEIYDEFMFYDVDLQKTYYIVLVKSTDPIFSTHSIVMHKYEI